MFFQKAVANFLRMEHSLVLVAPIFA